MSTNYSFQNPVAINDLRRHRLHKLQFGFSLLGNGLPKTAVEVHCNEDNNLTKVQLSEYND